MTLETILGSLGNITLDFMDEDKSSIKIYDLQVVELEKTTNLVYVY